MSSNRFKVSIPPGSLLEEELQGLSGRERNSRLYFLAELGALIERRNKAASMKSTQHPIREQVNNGSAEQKATLFDHDDLLQLSSSV